MSVATNHLILVLIGMMIWIQEFLTLWNRGNCTSFMIAEKNADEFLQKLLEQSYVATDS